MAASVIVSVLQVVKNMPAYQIYRAEMTSASASCGDLLDAFRGGWEKLDSL